ncbi:MAG: Cell division protein ZipA [Betaproteobacteria bacterium]|nr:Cell division protein ZipA [Betaproteobacteria bacterium]
MSDLQASLLIIGAVVVGGVTAFNWLQQWRLRRRLEDAFSDKPEDVLLRQEPAREPSTRVEPQLHGTARAAVQDEPDDWVEPPPAATAPVNAANTATVQALPPVPDFDSSIDYIAAIDASEPVSAAGLAELHTRAAAAGKRFRVVGFNPDIGEWEEAGRLSGGRYAHLRLAVQLLSRKGIVDVAALTAISEAVRECAARFSASAHCPDVHTAVVTARDLDAYCADVDVAIGVNVLPSAGESFAGTRIRTLAESAGFKLEPDGVFHYRDDARRTLFTLDNHEPAPFLPEQIKHLSTSGVTLLLDVPRVADGYTALDLMLRTGAVLAEGLGGSLVDDNRVPLNENSVRAIQQQLKSIHAKMEARGMAPGSERALRLFS